MGFLQRFGYLESRQDTNSEALIREEAVIDAIRTMQRFGGISPTGRMDNDTLEVNLVQWWSDCGQESIIHSESIFAHSCWWHLGAATKMSSWTMKDPKVEGERDSSSERRAGIKEK